MNAQFDQLVRPKLDLLKDLIEILGTDYDELPCILVLGSQSCGKSSVLERLGGIGLPRGERLCTRAPITLAIKKGPQIDARLTYKCKRKERVSKNVQKAEVASEVKHAMDQMTCAAKTTVVRSPVSLEVQGPQLPDLTLIDLPGVVYTEDEAAVKDILRKHVENRAAIILCVVSATEDVDSTEAFKLAREADPDMERTLAVFTKVDRMENPQSLHKLLLPNGGALGKLKLGIFAVRNHSTQEARDSIRDACTADVDEVKFFTELSSRCGLLPIASCGITALATRLCELQANSLAHHMPSFLGKIEDARAHAQENYEKLQLPASLGETARDLRRQIEKLKRLLRDIASANHNELEIPSLNLDEEDKQCLRIVPQLNQVEKSLVHELSQRRPKVFNNERIEDVKKELNNAAGTHLPNFLPHNVFDTLYRRWTQSYADLVRESFGHAKQHSLEAMYKCVDIAVHPQINNLVSNALEVGFEECLDRAQQEIEGFLGKEQQVIQTANSYYGENLKCLREHVSRKSSMEDGKDARAGLATVLQVKRGSKSVDTLLKLSHSHEQEDFQVLELLMSTWAYDKVVRKRLVDNYMQTIRFQLLTFLKDDGGVLTNLLDENVRAEQAHEALTAEEPAQKSKREMLQQKLNVLNDAHAKIMKIKGAHGIAKTTRVSKRRKLVTGAGA